MANINVGETHLTIYYRIQLDSGERFVFSAEPLSPEVARSVLGTTTEDYTLVTCHFPRALPCPFLRAATASVDFIIRQTALDSRTAALLAAILPPLTALRPADDILAAAEAWYKFNRQ